MVLLVDIFYDFTCQDLPPAIEDSHDEFFKPSSGWFQAFLAWTPATLMGDVRNPSFVVFSNTKSDFQADDTTPSLPSQIKTGILEIAEVSAQSRILCSSLNLNTALH